MDDHYLRQLPDDLQTLVEGTEQQSGLVSRSKWTPREAQPWPATLTSVGRHFWFPGKSSSSLRPSCTNYCICAGFSSTVSRR